MLPEFRGGGTVSCGYSLIQAPVTSWEWCEEGRQGRSLASLGQRRVPEIQNMAVSPPEQLHPTTQPPALREDGLTHPYHQEPLSPPFPSPDQNLQP